MPDIITRALLESKGIPTRDIVAAIWGRKLSGGYEPAEATGTLPLTFRSNGTALLDYRIYGNTVQNGTPTPESPIMPEGVGERTVNLFDITNVAQVTVPEIENRYGVTYADAGEYTIKTYGDTKNYLYAYQYNENDEQVAFAWIVQTPLARPYTFTLNSGDVLYLVTAVKDTTYADAIDRFTKWLPVVCKGSTAPASYIPYGYKLPMVSRSGTHRTETPIYIGNAQLMQDEYVSCSEQKIYKKVNGTLTPQDPPVPLPELPTFSDADTVLDYEETPAPEKAWVKYKKGD